MFLLSTVILKQFLPFPLLSSLVLLAALTGRSLLVKMNEPSFLPQEKLSLFLSTDDNEALFFPE